MSVVSLCVPKMALSLLLPGRASLCVSQGCPRPCCFPAKHCCVSPYSPMMSPLVLLPCRALQCIVPPRLSLCVAFLQSTMLCACVPQEVPIPVAALLSTVVSLQDVPICVASWKSITVYPWSEPWPAPPQAVAAGHPWGDGPEHPQLPAPLWVQGKTKGDGKAAGWRQNWQLWDRWELTGTGTHPLPSRATRVGVPCVGSSLGNGFASRQLG